jgi:hypothetical protein
VNNPKLAPTTNTTNNFQAPSRNPTRDTTAATHERPSKHQSRKPLADSLNAQKFADVTNLTNNSKVDQIVSPAKPAKNPPDVKLSKNTEDLLVKNQAAIAKSLDGLSAQSTNPQPTPPDTKLTQVPDNTEPDITPDDIEAAINGDIPTNPETKLRLPETPSKVKNLKKALKNILS